LSTQTKERAPPPPPLVFYTRQSFLFTTVLSESDTKKKNGREKTTEIFKKRRASVQSDKEQKDHFSSFPDGDNKKRNFCNHFQKKFPFLWVFGVSL
jgi:hypothetical protein